VRTVQVGKNEPIERSWMVFEDVMQGMKPRLCKY